MKKSKRIRVKVRKAKRAALADMEKALTLGQEVLSEMLNEGLFVSKPMDLQFNEYPE